MISHIHCYTLHCMPLYVYILLHYIALLYMYLSMYYITYSRICTFICIAYICFHELYISASQLHKGVSCQLSSSTINIRQVPLVGYQNLIFSQTKYCSSSSLVVLDIYFRFSITVFFSTLVQIYQCIIPMHVMPLYIISICECFYWYLLIVFSSMPI